MADRTIKAIEATRGTLLLHRGQVVMVYMVTSGERGTVVLSVMHDDGRLTRYPACDPCERVTLAPELRPERPTLPPQ